MTWTPADAQRSLPDAFREQVRARSDALAISGGATTATYADLDDAANRFAHLVLHRCGTGPGRIALLLDDDAPLVAATLGILMAGKVVVILNAGDPPSRLEQILDDAEPELVITDAARRDVLLEAGARASDVVIAAEPPDGPSTAPAVDLDPSDLAFLIYTSGSTGRPKGVTHTHRSLLHMFGRWINLVGAGPDDRIPQFVSASGLGGIATLWVALLSGGTACPFLVGTRGMAGLAEWSVQERVTVLFTYPTLFRHILRTQEAAGLPPVRMVALGGEPVTPADFAATRELFGADCGFLNSLGMTEVGMLTAYAPSDADLALSTSLPVGTPSDWIDLLVLDDDDVPVADGETGEIAVRSDFLAAGYWRDDALTAERFSESPSGRVFRTGDLGRLGPDGVLSIVGRRDSQVKVRGNRIALSELESALAAVPGVTGAVVGAAPNDRGDTRLTAFLTARPDAGLTATAVREHLRETVPQRETPTAFVFVDHIPYTANGKVDRQRLLEAAPAEQPAPGAAPATATERRLCAIWAAALDVDAIGTDDEFHDFEGDSLTAAEIAAAVHAEFGVEIELRAFSDTPTVASMAHRVDEQRGEAGLRTRPALLRAPRGTTLPLSYAQERVWRSTATPEGALDQNARIAVSLRGDLDVEALRASLDRVVARHEILRTTYAERDGAPVQIAQRAEPLDLPLRDLSAEADPQARAREDLHRQALRPFDLGRDRPVRLQLVRLAPREHWLMGTVHHIAMDAWSWRQIFAELRELYEAHVADEPAPLAQEPAFQYADFAMWERRNLNPAMPRYQREVAHWTQALRDADPRPLELPCTWAQPPAQAPDRSAGMVRWGFGSGLSRRLDDLGRELRATPYVTRLALFAAQAAEETGREQLVIGAYMTNRRLVELQSMIGDFTNLTTLVLRPPAGRTFRGWVDHVRAVVESTSAHSEVAYEELVEKLRRRGVSMPHISTVFGRDQQAPPIRLGEVEIGEVPTMRQMAPNGFAFSSNPGEGTDDSFVYFDVRTYDPALVRAFADRHCVLAERAVADPDRPLGT